jgi:hypothetical protein
MAQETEKIRVEGALVRGADGHLYFIPKDDLEVFRVPDELSERAKEVLDEVEARGFDWTPTVDVPVRTLPTIWGPIGLRDAMPTPSPQDPTVSAL